jgi:RHS repeat-associated protein
MYDKETSMYYLMARYYHPVHGVFLSVDPDPGDEDDSVTQNGYTYGNNNPVMNLDPDGNMAFLAGLAFIPVWGWVALGTLIVGYGLLKVYEKGGFVQAKPRSSDIPNPDAKGRPHTKVKVKNGKIVGYTTFDSRGNTRKQFRGEETNQPHHDKKTGRSIPRPNVKDYPPNKNNPYTGRGRERVRTPKRWELPRSFR